MPIGFDFPGKEKDEQVVLLLRRHPFILFKQNFIFLIYFFIPVLVYVVGKFWLTFLLNFPIYPIFVLLVSVYYSFFLMFLLIEWIDYYFDVWVVTNKRLVDVDQIGLFKRVVSETRLDRIQDATVEITGMFGTLFHFGNVHVQTAARQQRFEIKQVPNPIRVRSVVLNMYDKYTHHLAKRSHPPQPPTPPVAEPVPPADVSVPPPSTSDAPTNNPVPPPDNSNDSNEQPPGNSN